MNSDADFADIRQRLDRLEKQNHRLKLLAAVMLLAVGAVLVFGLPQVGEAQAKKAGKTVEATKFVLLDDKGKKQAVLEMDAGSPRLMFLDLAGEEVGIYRGESLLLGSSKTNRLPVVLAVNLFQICDNKGALRLKLVDGELTVQNKKGTVFKAP